MLYFNAHNDFFNLIVIVFFQASEELEDRESLAQIAASGEDTSLSDGETYIGWFDYKLKYLDLIILHIYFLNK